MHRAENGSYWIAFLAGELTARLALLQDLAGRVTKRMVPDQNFEFTAQLIQTPNNEAILKQAGVEPDKHEPVISLYESNL
jgi:hypothetical protein